MQPVFATDYTTILERIDAIDPMKYGRTRNFVDGDVSYLSPYISRGVISTKQVLDHVMLKGYKIPQIETFVKELCWRDYFQRVEQVKNLNEDIKHPQEPVNNHEIPSAILEASISIEGIDTAIRNLYDTGYMHNHCRMYTASVVCNIAQSHWLHPARWMYYHLLDGDWASNACSWQWVAGTFNGRKYYCNQRNIDQYFHTNQPGSFLDQSYEALPKMPIPDVLQPLSDFTSTTVLPNTPMPSLDVSKPLYIYNSYNLDPNWDASMDANRLLLLEPSHFKRFPISDTVLNFILELSKNIPGVEVFVGEVNEIPGLRQFPKIVSKEHPAFRHYPGEKQERDWMFPGLTVKHTSFFRFWKQAENKAKKMAGAHQIALALH